MNTIFSGYLPERPRPAIAAPPVVRPRTESFLGLFDEAKGLDVRLVSVVGRSLPVVEVHTVAAQGKTRVLARIVGTQAQHEAEQFCTVHEHTLIPGREGQP